EARRFKIGSEKYIADFGSIALPENRNQPKSRLIQIPFLRIRSRSEKSAEPVFGLTGGPGSSNMSWDWGKAWTFLPDHDFVLVGYRGIDGSTVLECPEVVKAFKGKNIISEESLKKIGAAWNKDAEELKSRGIDFDGYTMLECIEDNESVRKALGYDRINLLSESYGTRVAYLYGLKHPEFINRSAMIGVNPPGRFVWEPAVIDEQLKYYSALWSKDSHLDSESNNLYSTIGGVLNAMPRKWLFFTIDPGKVKVVTFALLFHRKTAAMVFDSYSAAARGDPSGLALMSLAHNFVVPGMMTWGDLASKAVSADYDPARNYITEMDPTTEFPLGSPMSKLLWGTLGYGRWPIRMLPEELRKLQPSGVETLLLSGSIDFSTPSQFAAEELLPNLKNGRQIILSECGHVNDVWYVNVENTRRILTSFYNTGKPDDSLNAYIPMNFEVTQGFPTIARISLGAIILVVIGLLWALFRIIKFLI
ncbi:MAG TPA: alpha/beta hydrolase, partial [Cyclobacteriaceae bacterium]|nr:alpha/beta hydrolase [Cyclobacteriaceae bacterium]